MTDDHRVARVEEDIREIKRDIAGYETRLRSVESFRDATNEKITMILEMINELKATSKWLRQTLTSSLIGAIITAVTSVIIWLIKG